MDRFVTYRRLVVYQHAKALAHDVYLIVNQFPDEEKFALSNQLRRAVCSIPSNIAEGMGPFSAKEQIHFIEIAYGSTNETLCQLELAESFGYISSEDFEKIEKQIIDLFKLLSGLRKSNLNKQ